MPFRVQNYLEYHLNITMSDYSRTSKRENFATRKITFVYKCAISTVHIDIVINLIKIKVKVSRDRPRWPKGFRVV